jgi:hypothetical protein
MTARILHFPHRAAADVIPFRPPTPTGYTVAADPALTCEVLLLGQLGSITKLCASMAQRALTGPDAEVWEARVGGLIAIGYEYQHVAADARAVLLRVVREIAPGYTARLLADLLGKTGELERLHGTGDRGGATAHALAELRTIAGWMATEPTTAADEPDGAA